MHNFLFHKRKATDIFPVKNDKNSGIIKLTHFIMSVTILEQLFLFRPLPKLPFRIALCI